MALYNNGADVPSPPEASNGFSQAGASGTWHKGEEEARLAEPSLVKKAHREILDHERKRRVELKCMELQEMMEEQGYSEEEIRQKVGTFRQMLMEKEGVLTREDQHGRQIVIENHHAGDGEEYGSEYQEYGGGAAAACATSRAAGSVPTACAFFRRLKRRSSSSTSPPPKKKKKKKSGHRRSRKKRKPGSERSCDSSSPIRKEKKKKAGKKHRRDRSESGSRKKRRHRSRSPKNKRKEKNKERKRSHSGSPAWRLHRRSSCSSHSASLSSDYSNSKSPSRLSPKHREDGPKGSSRRMYVRFSWITVRFPDCFPPLLPQQDPWLSSPASSPLPSPVTLLQARGTRLAGPASPPRHRGQSKARTAAPREASPPPLSPTGYSSDSEGSACSHPYHPPPGAEKNHGAHAKKVKERHHRGRPNSSSESSAKHSRHTSERKKSLSHSTGHRSSSWSSSGSLSKSRSRSREKRAARSRTRSPSQKKTASREKDNEPRTRHSDPDPARARRRSRSYSPIRKRRRDSPSFMEPRRITRPKYPESHRRTKIAATASTACPGTEAQPVSRARCEEEPSVAFGLARLFPGGRPKDDADEPPLVERAAARINPLPPDGKLGFVNPS
ncbi:PREDICTED: serine/arginine repetitive matrix protein 3 [Tinamus guttatus]|uniref:serine/arginine repetitive matrix protein 3 n=1 Tax=Tinamus guttatus TaxID=94827 RepID=UPI00052EEC0F|nr:PREDICTED: serine/arginine repetitive matrix protein 3 [Tinamus guttatus]